MLRTDMRVTCKHCGGPHPAFECRKRSTAVRKDVLGQQETASLALNHSKRSKAVTTAGTQALPVDTNPGPERATKVIVPSAEGATPSPGAKFDKKAYMKTYMKTYMARYREDVKSGKRTPKKKVKAS